MSEETKEEEAIASAVKLVTMVLSKKGAAGVLVVILLGGGGGGFLANLAHVLYGPMTSVEISSPQMQQLVQTELEPVQALVEGQEREIQGQAVQLYDIEQAVDRNTESNQQTAENLVEATQALNKLAGQMEILVQFETRRLGVSR